MTRPLCRVGPALLALALASCGSSDPVTEIIVVVDTDMDIPSQIDAVTVEAPGMQSASGPLAGSDVEPLPRTVGLQWTGGSLGPFTVRVVGTLEGAEVVERVAVTSFVEGRSLLLPMHLARVCESRRCADGETCNKGSCVSADVDPSSLAEWSGDETPIPRIDAGEPCVPDSEACNGADDDCDGEVDEDFDLATDPLNCGGCMNACTRPNALVACVDRACSVTGCEGAFQNCDGDPANGCEDDLTSIANCGACGTSCSFPNGIPACESGACVLSGCMDGFEDCNADPADGCEVDLRTSPTNCGGCGTVCTIPNATAACADRACVIASCDPLFDNCDGDLTNGCETPTNTLVDCGGCGTPCSVAGGTATCADGTCRVDTCDPLLADCNADASDGCETPTNTATDCVTCGTPCAIANGTASCDTGACLVTGCDAELADCNMDASDGCEVNVRRDEMNCGTCGRVCMAPTPMCMNFDCR